MRWTLLLLSAVCVAAVGCREDKLQKTLPPDVRVDTYTQQSASKIDVLWVVDNSGSMAPRQQNLARNFNSFIDVFTRSAVDYRLAVTTTDIFNATTGQGHFVGSPAVVSPQTPNSLSAFQANIKVGTSGSPYEAGMEAASMALDRQLQANAGALQAIDSCKGSCGKSSNVTTCVDACVAAHPVDFLRPDAYFYLIFVSDEDDKSSSDVRYYYRKFETANGIGNDGTVATAAIIGTANNSCGAEHGARYEALSQLTGGEVGNICDAEFATTLHNLATTAVGLKRTFALGKAPNESTIEVRIIYPCSTASDVTKPCKTVDATGCSGQPSDSYNLICTPNQGGTDGWEYQPATHTIFFHGDSVPGVNSHLELQYYEEGKP